jgi:hypothetical protein
MLADSDPHPKGLRKMLVAQRFLEKKRVPVVEKPSRRPFLETYQKKASKSTIRTPASLKGLLTRRILFLRFVASLADECNRPNCQRTAASQWVWAITRLAPA